MNFNYDEKEYRELFESDETEFKKMALKMNFKEPSSRGSMISPKKAKLKKGGAKNFRSGIKFGREYLSTY